MEEGSPPSPRRKKGWGKDILVQFDIAMSPSYDQCGRYTHRGRGLGTEFACAIKSRKREEA